MKIRNFDKKSKYSLIKYLSKKENLAQSTLKYNLYKLREKGLIDFNGKIEITEKGLFLIKLLGMLSNGKIFGSRPKDGSSILPVPIKE